MADTISPWPRAQGAPAGRRREPWPYFSLPLLVFLVLPLAALLLRVSPERVLGALGTTAVRQAIGLTLGTSTAATLLTLILGTPTAFWIAHQRTARRRVVETLVDLPLVLPPAIAGLSLLMAFGRSGLLAPVLRAAGIDVAFTPVAVVLAQTFVAAPLYVRAAAISYGEVEPALEQAAALDGAGHWQLFRSVILPMAWPAMLGGAAMTWARALGEFGATIIFAGNFPGRTQTMSLAIYMGFEIDLNLALTLSVVLIGLSLLVLALVRGLLQRDPEGR
ncbi:MAG: ABC transporter permease [Chloroflexota bacterium]